MPDAFPSAQALDQHIAGPVLSAMMKLIGMRGVNEAGSSVLAGGNTTDPNLTAAHEAAHSVWDAMPEDQRNQWRAVHKADPLLAGSGYANNPDHAFAEAYGLYAGTGKTFQQQSPAAYDFIRNLSGFEYSRPGHHMSDDRFDPALAAKQGF